jgi:hypothetical protein
MLAGAVKVRRESSAGLWLICRGRLGATAVAATARPDLFTMAESGSRPTELCYERFTFPPLAPERTEVIFRHVAHVVRGVDACGDTTSHE